MTKGDVANVTGESEANDAAAPKETKSKKKKSTTSTKTAASSRSRVRGRSKIAKEKEEAETSKPAARASSKAATKKDAGDIKATKKKGGVKRENNSQPSARESKRSRNIPVFEPRNTRSRSASRRLASKKEVTRKHENVKIITDDDHIVPLDFRLHRESFDGTNFTDGIAHYDAARRSDPQRVTEYITDYFQHLYKAEVSEMLLFTSWSLSDACHCCLYSPCFCCLHLPIPTRKPTKWNRTCFDKRI